MQGRGLALSWSMPLPSAILETALDVADLARSMRFYAELFGYPVLVSDESFCAYDVNGQQVLLLFRQGRDPGGTVLPFGKIPSHGATGPGHVGFSVPEESLVAWRAQLGKLDIAIESEFRWPNGGASIYFRDPDGHLLELLSPGVWPTY